MCGRSRGVTFRLRLRGRCVPGVGIVNINKNNKGTIGHVITARIGGIRFVTVGASRRILELSGTSRGVRVNRGLAENGNTNSVPRVKRRTTRRDESRVTTLLGSASVMFIATNVNNNANANTTPMITGVTGSVNVLAINIIAGPFTFRNGEEVARTRRNVTRLSTYISSLVVIPGRELGCISSADVALRGTFTVTSSILERNIRDVSSLVLLPNLMGLSFTSIASMVGSTNCTRVNVNDTANGSGTAITTSVTVSDPLLRASVSNTGNLVVGVATSTSIDLSSVSTTSAVVGSGISSSTGVV